MFIPNGWSFDELGDMDLIAAGPELHMFHLELPSHDRVGHAVSTDGMRWRRLPHALHTGEPGEFDNDMIWTMHAFPWEGKYCMLYTALCTKERGRLQRTGLATSVDLIVWHKSLHNPVAVPDPRWYEADLNDSGRADWRDPFPWIEDGVIHALVCAHENSGPYNRRGCVAHLSSTDSIHWQVREPFYTPRISGDYEVPTLMKLGGRYYLIGHIVAPLIDTYRVAESLSGPWRRPASDWVLPPPNHAFAPTVFKGRTILVNWISAEIDWPTGTTAQRTRIITPPREAVASLAGELILKSYEPGWDAVADGDAVAISPKDIARSDQIFRGQWDVDGDQIVARCTPGMGLARLGGEHRDFIFECDVEPRDAVVFGVAWRSDDTADQCTRAAITPGRQAIELHRIVRGYNYNAIGRGHTTLQTNFCRVDLGARLKLRLVAWGPYVEVSVNERILLSHMTLSRRSGSIGLFVEDGEARFVNPMLRTLRAPDGFTT